MNYVNISFRGEAVEIDYETFNKLKNNRAKRIQDKTYYGLNPSKTDYFAVNRISLNANGEVSPAELSAVVSMGQRDNLVDQFGDRWAVSRAWKPGQDAVITRTPRDFGGVF